MNLLLYISLHKETIVVKMSSFTSSKNPKPNPNAKHINDYTLLFDPIENEHTLRGDLFSRLFGAIVFMGIVLAFLIFYVPKSVPYAIAGTVFLVVISVLIIYRKKILRFNKQEYSRRINFIEIDDP